MAQKNGGKKSEKDTQEFESDTQKIIHRHLENKDDVISEEDIRNVRIGMVPPDALTSTEELEESVTEEIEESSDDGTAPNAQPLTSFDVVE